MVIPCAGKEGNRDELFGDRDIVTHCDSSEGQLRSSYSYVRDLTDPGEAPEGTWEIIPFLHSGKYLAKSFQVMCL